MVKLNFDKKIFNRGCAFIYTLLQYIFVAGFIFTICGIVLNSIFGTIFTVPDVLSPFIAVYLIAAIIGFPLITVVKKGYKRLAEGSTLTYDNETLIYDKLADRLWTAVGHVEEHHVYIISQIESVTVTKAAYIIKGSIEKTVINNGRKLETKSVSVVKIPNAYANMERVIRHG